MSYIFFKIAKYIPNLIIVDHKSIKSEEVFDDLHFSKLLL